VTARHDDESLGGELAIECERSIERSVSHELEADSIDEGHSMAQAPK
jgi:hypothetical protein